MKRISTGRYWLVTLLGTFCIQRVLGMSLLTDERLLAMFAYDVSLDTLMEFANSIVVVLMRPASLAIGLLAAASYNYRVGRVLLNQRQEIIYQPSNQRASLLCGALGSLGAFWVLLMVTVGYTQLIVGGALFLFTLPLLAMFAAMPRFCHRKIVQHLACAPVRHTVYYRRVDTLAGAFEGILPWENRAFRIVTEMAVFSTSALAIFYALEGPLNGLIREALLQAGALSDDNPFTLILKTALEMTLTFASFMPMLSGIVSAIGYEAFVVGPLCTRVHPATLLAGAPLVAVAAFVGLLCWMLAGLYSFFWFLLVGAVVFVAVSRSPVTAAAMTARAIKRRNVPFERSLPLRIILGIGVALLIISLIGGFTA